MISHDVRTSLEGWKFQNANDGMLNELAKDPGAYTSFERFAVSALSNAFGNSGSLDGTIGDIITAAVESLIRSETVPEPGHVKMTVRFTRADGGYAETMVDDPEWSEAAAGYGRDITSVIGTTWRNMQQLPF
jgi:hypothetical protein